VLNDIRAWVDHGRVSALIQSRVHDLEEKLHHEAEDRVAHGRVDGEVLPIGGHQLVAVIVPVREEPREGECPVLDDDDGGKVADDIEENENTARLEPSLAHGGLVAVVEAVVVHIVEIYVRVRVTIGVELTQTSVQIVETNDELPVGVISSLPRAAAVVACHSQRT